MESLLVFGPVPQFDVLFPSRSAHIDVVDGPSRSRNARFSFAEEAKETAGSEFEGNARRSRPPPSFSLSALHHHLISSQLSSPTNYQSRTTTARGPTSLSRPRTTPPSRSTSATSTPRASSPARRRHLRSPATSAPGAPPTPRSTCCGRYGDDDCLSCDTEEGML